MNVPFFRYDWFFQENREQIISVHEEIMSSGRYVYGEYTQKLEKQLAELCNRKFATTVGSCTDALFFALQSVGIKDGDEVIVPPFSFVATLDSILRCGGVPVFVDISPEHFMLDIAKLEDAITQRTKAIVLVQLFGNCHPQQETIHKIAQKNGIPLIIDAAQAVGIKSNGISSAKVGDIACISFDPTKIVSAYGTGGAVLTDDENTYTTIKKLANHGLCNGTPEIAGYNSKISEQEAAYILLQIEKLPQTMARMNEVSEKYLSQLNGIEEIVLPHKCCTEPNCHKFVISTDKRDKLRNYLKDNGIETKIHYATLLSEQKILKGHKFLKHNLSNAEKASKQVLSLPIYPNITDEEISYVCQHIKAFFCKSRH